ncbi:MAG: hypothetical protein IT379_05090 [Deltaproteobacteria bacterium]|nr:hypothetical protein [Deltaproteobacteria bacterium]
MAPARGRRVACVRAPATGELDELRCFCGQDVIDLAVEGDVARVLPRPPHRASPSTRPEGV